MGKIERFEDLIAWQRARVLTREIYVLTREPQFSKDFALVNQIRRAAVSIMSNITEGFERRGLGEFHHFLLMAKASCAEVRSQLYIALDADYIDQSRFYELMKKAEEVGRIIGGLCVAVAAQKSQKKPPNRSGARDNIPNQDSG